MSKVSQSNRSYANWIDCHPSVAKQLPIEDTFQKQDLPSELQDYFGQMTLDGLLEKVHHASSNRPESSWWRVSPEARPLLRELKDNHEGRLPCGHDGFSNLRDCPLYECTVCEERFERDEIE